MVKGAFERRCEILFHERLPSAFDVFAMMRAPRFKPHRPRANMGNFIIMNDLQNIGGFSIARGKVVRVAARVG